MTFWERLVFFLLTLGVAWYFNSEKNRFLDKANEANKNQDERSVGEFEERSRFYGNALGVMSFVVIIMFIFLLTGEF